MSQMSTARRDRRLSGVDPIQQKVRMEIAENAVCSKVGMQLEKHYPGYSWLIVCVWHTGVVTVKNQHIHGDYGFVIKLEDLMDDPNLIIPVKAGGELLERCNLPRGPRPDNWKDYIKQDGRGDAANLDMQGVEGKREW